MSSFIHFFVTGTPKGQPRVKARAMPKAGKHVAQVYDPGTADGWKTLIAIAARRYGGDLPALASGPAVRVDADFLFPRPLRLMRQCARDGEIPYTGKPDRDNLDKALLDTLTREGFWRDDAQVCDGRIRKLYAAKGQPPGVRVTITPILWDGP